MRKREQYAKKVRVSGFRLCVLGQIRHASRDQSFESKVLECAFGSRSVRKVKMLAVKWRFWIVTHAVCHFEYAGKF